jgi:hypothetical protein
MPIDPTHPNVFILSLLGRVNSDGKVFMESGRIIMFFGVISMTWLPHFVADLKFKQLSIR